LELYDLDSHGVQQGGELTPDQIIFVEDPEERRPSKMRNLRLWDHNELSVQEQLRMNLPSHNEVLGEIVTPRRPRRLLETST
jgi:hypothetical protein